MSQNRTHEVVKTTSNPPVPPARLRAALALPALAAAEPLTGLASSPWMWVAVTAGAGAAGLIKWVSTPKGVVNLRRRLRLRMHPGAGFASLWELYRGYGRGPARRIAKRARPALTWRDRWFGPAREYAIFLGWARPGRVRAYATLRDVTLVIAPPQQGKSAAAAGRVIDAPGPVVVTSIRGDLIAMTAGVRQQHGHLHVFNPGSVGDYGSTLKWNLVAGCQDPETAVRRAGYLVSGVQAGVSDAGFWQDQAVLTLAGYLQAGGLTCVTLRTVHRWIIDRDETPLRVLERHADASPECRLAVAAYLSLPDRTQASVATTIRNTLKFLINPSAADAVEPRTRAELFDVDQFLTSRDTLYLVANADAAEMAPLFLCFVSELFNRAVQEGSSSRTGALDPPLSLVLDEVANICPIPVQSWATYAAGSGISMHLIGQAWAHFKARWGGDGADVIWQAATCKILYTASSDTEMMERVSKLAGDVRVQTGTEKVSDGKDASGQPRYRLRPIHERVPVLPPSEMRRLPPWHAVVILGSRRPTVVQVERGWLRADYKAWVKSGQQIQLPGVRSRPTPTPRPELLTGEPVGGPVSRAAVDELTSRRERRQVPADAPPLPLARPAEQTGTAGGGQVWRPWDASRPSEQTEQDPRE